MSVAIVTGAAGLIGSESVRFYAEQGMDVVGIDNDMRAHFFGDAASTKWNRDLMLESIRRYSHVDEDIRDVESISRVFERYGKDIAVVVHTAAQPSHDWAASDPRCDFEINALGTLNLLEATRHNCPDSAFVFTSTNKVYGDSPNRLEFVELEKRWELPPASPFYGGIPETFGVDQCLHSLFGASKLAADALVQEYGLYFGLRTVSFRGGCLTGPHHSGAMLHGFLSYLIKCGVTGAPYKVLGYSGKQVRDNIHSHDFVRAVDEFVRDPDCGVVYNMGGGRASNCSILEAIDAIQELSAREMNLAYDQQNRVGDHIWYISDLGKFETRYPDWSISRGTDKIISEIYQYYEAELRK